jgi:hypothetical protein
LIPPGFTPAGRLITFTRVSCMRSSLVLAVVLTTAVAMPAAAQFPPDHPKNLKVLPMDIPVRALLDTMRTFTGALGVRCNFCHVGKEGEPLSSYDFAADDKPEKTKARVMMRMVKAIDGEYLTQLASRTQPPVVVTCMTCHRGVNVPRPLDQAVLAAYDSGGVDSAEAKYNALRERYYGRASYDFSEAALAAVSQSLVSRGEASDAARLSMLNTRMSPNSAFAFRQAAEAQLAAADTAAAVASMQRVLAINPNDQQAKRTLDRVKKTP